MECFPVQMLKATAQLERLTHVLGPKDAAREARTGPEA